MPLSVLVVEDNDFLARAISHVLVACSMDVTSVSTMAEAMSEAMIRQPNLILLDLKLPDSSVDSTIDSIARLKEISPDSQVAVISGELQESLRHRVLEAGAVSFTEKGVGMGTRKEILQVLLESLKHGSRTIQENVSILEKALGEKLS